MHESELDELEEAVGDEIFEELLTSVVKLPHDPLYVRTYSYRGFTVSLKLFPNLRVTPRT